LLKIPSQTRIWYLMEELRATSKGPSDLGLICRF
jgi:hypothetical protein